MRKYFLYELKKSAYAIGVITLIMSVIYLLPMLGMLGLGFMFKYEAQGAFVWLISLLAGFLAAGVPMRVFAYRTKRRSVDLYFSLPLSHTKILTVKFLIGLIAVFVPYTISYWIGAIVDTVASGNPYAVYYIPQYFASLIPIYIIYAISAFTFTRANSTSDGVLFMIFWTFVLFLITLIFDDLTTRTVYVGTAPYYSVTSTRYFIPDCYLPFSPLDEVTAHFQSLIRIGATNPKYTTVGYVNIIIAYTLTTLMAAGSTVGLFLLEKKAKAENAGQISESPFGYRTMIPIYTTSLIVTSMGSLILFIMIAIGAYLLTAAYRRTLNIGKKQVKILLISVAAGLMVWFIIWVLQNFGVYDDIYIN